MILLRLLIILLGLLITLTAVVLRPLVIAFITPVVATLIGPLAVIVGIILLTTLLLEARIQNTVVMIGMLKVVFRQYAIARGTGVTRHDEEFFHELLGIAPHAPTIAAVEVGVAATATATARARFAAITAALTILHIVMRLIIHQNEATF